MIRSYSTPMAFQAALEARIRERARVIGRPMNRVRQLLVMERFLVRVFQRLEAVVLKGGMVMELRLARARTTRDVDLRATVNPERLLAQLREAGRMELEDHLSFEVERNENQPDIEADGLLYEGQRFRVTATLAGRRYGETFGVDLVVGEPIVGTPQAIAGDDLLSFVGIPVPAFYAIPVAAHIAEKLHAYTLPRPRPNSRVKDLPDIALLATLPGIHADILQKAIQETFRHRSTHEVPTSLPAPSSTWDPAYARMATVDGLPWPTLGELTAAIRFFLDPVLAGERGTWDAGAWR